VESEFEDEFDSESELEPEESESESLWGLHQNQHVQIDKVMAHRLGLFVDFSLPLPLSFSFSLSFSLASKIRFAVPVLNAIAVRSLTPKAV
jgi:hypothetical protein